MPYSWENLLAYAAGSKIEALKRVPELVRAYRDHLNVEKYHITKALNKQYYLFVDNKYPYDVEKGITHKVLFVRPQYDLSTVIPMLLQGLLPGKTFIYFKNASHNLSIPEFPHYHVFIHES